MSIDPDLIERARAVNMLVVTEQHGLKLAKRRQEYIGACPHCGGCSRFSVNPGKAVFLCRGCKTGGCGAIDLKIFVSGCSFTEAIEALTGEHMPSADEARAAAAARKVQDKATQAEQIQRRAGYGSSGSGRKAPSSNAIFKPAAIPASFQQRSATCQRATNIHPP